MADATGGVAVAWDEVVAGRRAASVRRVTIGPSRGVTFGEVVTLAADGAALYPVLAATNRGLVAAWTTGGDRSVIKVRTIDP